MLIATASGALWSQLHSHLVGQWLGRSDAAPTDEIVIFSLAIAALTALSLALLNHVFGLKLLSRLSGRVTFVLIPPLILIFLVLGTIFLGIATPTEGGALGALGALIMALARGQLSKTLLVQALDNTTRLTAFVMFILIGSTVFSFTFNAADGQAWVGHLFDKLPGGALGFLLVVNLLVFVLGMFIDFFEIAFIVVPLLAPIADRMGIDLVWFGVILAMNLQTSFLTPPFGFALFYLRSVAANHDSIDRITGARIPGVTTAQIYSGSIAFIVLQLLMVAALIRWPALVLDQINGAPEIGAMQLQAPDSNSEIDDPMRDLLEVIRREQTPAPQH
jgi:tripartite ATP-independent transporter DctM subunit